MKRSPRRKMRCYPTSKQRQQERDLVGALRFVMSDEFDRFIAEFDRVLILAFQNMSVTMQTTTRAMADALITGALSLEGFASDEGHSAEFNWHYLEGKDEAHGMLLSELLDDSTLAWLDKKGKR